MIPRLKSAKLVTCWMLALVLALSACGVPTTLPTAPAATNPPQPTSTTGKTPAVATTAVEATTAAAASPTASAKQPTDQPVISAKETPETTRGETALGKLITAQNAASLTATPLTLPGGSSQLLWTGRTTLIPGIRPTPPLVIRAENSFIPVKINPPSVGQPVAIQVPGNIVAFNPDLTAALSQDSSGPATLYDLSGKVLQRFDLPVPYAGAFSSDGKLAAITSQSEIAAGIYNTATGQQAAKLSGFQTAAPVYSVNFVPGKPLIYWTARANLQFQDITTGQLGQKLSYQDFIGSVAFTPDGSHMILYVAGNLYLYSVPDAAQLAEINVSQPVSSLSVSPDGKLVAAGYGANIQIWDAATLAPITTLPGPNDFTGQVSFSPDGMTLVSVHNNNILEIWKVK